MTTINVKISEIEYLKSSSECCVEGYENTILEAEEAIKNNDFEKVAQAISKMNVYFGLLLSSVELFAWKKLKFLKESAENSGQ